jgi:hypothetical protein
MIVMSDPNPLHRAHNLSAQASQLTKSPQTSLSSLNQALTLYQEAAELFTQASSGSSGDEATKKTLDMLVVQHHRMIKDLERRIITAKRSGIENAATGDVPGPVTIPPSRVTLQGGSIVNRVGLGSPRNEGMTLGLAGMSGMTGWGSPTGLGPVYHTT